MFTLQGLFSFGNGFGHRLLSAVHQVLPAFHKWSTASTPHADLLPLVVTAGVELTTGHRRPYSGVQFPWETPTYINVLLFKHYRTPMPRQGPPNYVSRKVRFCCKQVFTLKRKIIDSDFVLMSTNGNVFIGVSVLFLIEFF